jgi:hypothetical protein
LASMMTSPPIVFGSKLAGYNEGRNLTILENQVLGEQRLLLSLMAPFDYARPQLQTPSRR